MITCKEYVAIQKERLAQEVSAFELKPKLCVIQIGDNPASNSYIKGKKKDCAEIGIECEHIHLTDEDNLDQSLYKIIISRNSEMRTNGIIVQLPLPETVTFGEELIQSLIRKEKDVDGFRRDSWFTPCTPKGVLDYLEYNKIDLTGKVCTIIGRSNIVGKPLVKLLIERGATVISCNSHTKDLKHFTKESDVIFSAIGKPNYFDSSYFSKGQILVDIGINRDKNGKLCGDICESAKENMLLATPVPGGVGLLTRLALMKNVVSAYKLQCESR